MCYKFHPGVPLPVTAGYRCGYIAVGIEHGINSIKVFKNIDVAPQDLSE